MPGEDLPETTELQAFVAVVDAGSVSRAAQTLGLPRATVSRRLARLEERLGVRLLRRSTRRSALTAEGEELHRRARGVLAAVHEASAAVIRADGAPRGLLRVSLPPANGMQLAGLVLGFLEAYPEVRLEVEWSSRHVDLVGEGVDVALRAGSAIDPGLIARRLRVLATGAWASPAYVARAGMPSQPAELGGHACLLSFARGQRPDTLWPLRAGGTVQVRGRLASNGLEALREACLRGLGIALLPDAYVAGAVRAGRLVPVLPGVVGAQVELALVYPERAFLPPAVRAFVDHVAAAVARGELGVPDGG